MSEVTTGSIQFPVLGSGDVLTGILREGAARLLAQAVEAEVADYIERHAAARDCEGHRLVVRNGHLPGREIQTGIGPVKVRQPRVNDKRIDEALGDLDEAVKRDPKDATAWFLMGNARAGMKRADANEAFCKASELGFEKAAALCKK